MFLFKQMAIYREGVSKGQEALYTTAKEIELTSKARELMDQYRGDPSGFNTAFDEYRTYWLRFAPAHLTQHFVKFSDRRKAAALTLRMGID